MGEGTRGELLDRLAGVIESVTTSHPLRVAVDARSGRIVVNGERYRAKRD